MKNTTNTVNNKFGHLFILLSALMPLIVVLEMTVEIGQNLTFISSIIITVALIVSSGMLLLNKKISKWLFVLVAISDILLLTCNYIIYRSYGYNYSEFLGQDFFYFDGTKIDCALAASCIVFVVTYIIYWAKLKKEKEQIQ